LIINNFYSTLLTDIPFHHANLATRLPSFINQIVDVVQSACEAVQEPIVHQAPEGALPDEEQDADIDDEDVLESTTCEADLDSHKSKLILGHAWRTVREAFNLLSALLTATDAIPKETLFRLGNSLLMPLLTSIRHNGAYWSVAATFGVLCHKVVSSNDVETQEYLGLWLPELLRAVEGTAGQVSITRRSAGLPFSITAIVIAECSVRLRAANSMKRSFTSALQAEFTPNQLTLTNPSRQLLSITVDYLLKVAQKPATAKEIAENQTDLPQVHAFNILKAISQDNKMGEEIHPWMAELVQLAILGFNSAWYALFIFCKSSHFKKLLFIAGQFETVP
jgi:hypothetical protein